MSAKLTLYTNPMSRGRIARWMLEEVGVTYETKLLNYGGEMKTPEYLAINPMGKVPTLVHGDAVVTESAAICAYLADAFPEADLLPAVADRGSYYRWLFFAAGPVESAVTNKGLGIEIPRDREVSVGYGKFSDVVALLEARLLESPYIAGEKFTAADVYVGSQISFSMMFGTMDSCPAFNDYVARVESRSAFIKAREIDDARSS